MRPAGAADGICSEGTRKWKGAKVRGSRSSPLRIVTVRRTGRARLLPSRDCSVFNPRFQVVLISRILIGGGFGFRSGGQLGRLWRARLILPLESGNQQHGNYEHHDTCAGDKNPLKACVNGRDEGDRKNGRGGRDR